ncbi:MAG: aldehyde dehydrogenase family protein [Actinobacteria bacterium]|jgi:alpha-ketoglutaric semialdehyde dehydrogenase|nr:aldehyde dehydrogenase family protein [Actinomycetota bacterium]NCW34647.1 aldehyde dehydrogenase family protein [Actinomycetota bacterium]NCZ73114.1 aldehyde dehydrogenase family protein [Actinomycetota bacterium]NDA41244.1 aldehyde dehydrogenase family protein [Actinomycetota bacterium]NDB31078.1 aldehyde dehydrogenase family protein [Actinomycetota bacterium]
MTFTSTNPADFSEIVGTVPAANASDIVEALRRAKKAQAEWAKVPAPARGRVIANVGRLVEKNKESLSRIVTREMGKVYREALGEVQEVVDTCDFFLGEGRRLYGQTVPSEMPKKNLFTFRNPVGSVFIITAGNFPAAVPSWYLVPALLAGNSVVWKPSEFTPVVAKALTSLFHAGGIPKDLLITVVAEGEETFKALDLGLKEGLINKVGFTGSTEVGRKIGAKTGEYIQSACLELGGKNPMVVMPDANLDLALEGALFAGFGTAGQRCTSLGTLWLHESIYDAFLARYSSLVGDAKVGDPFSDVLYGPMISERYLDNHLRHLEMIKPHHHVSGSSALGRITQSNPRSGFVGDPDKGFFAHPTIVAGIKSDDELYYTETFGPLVTVGKFKNLDEAIELSNGHGYGLSSSIYTKDPENVWRFREGISAGMVSINNSTSGAEAHLPFGGNGKSGNGSRQSGIWVLDQFTRWQAMNWDWSNKLQKAQMDTIEIEHNPDFLL